MVDLTEAAEAAAREMLATPGDYPGPEQEFEWTCYVASRALTAAIPLIEAQVREQVAREIEAWTEQYAIATGWTCDHDFDGATCGRCFGNARHASAVAARVARNTA